MDSPAPPSSFSLYPCSHMTDKISPVCYFHAQNPPNTSHFTQGQSFYNSLDGPIPHYFYLSDYFQLLCLHHFILASSSTRQALSTLCNLHALPSLGHLFFPHSTFHLTHCIPRICISLAWLSILPLLRLPQLECKLHAGRNFCLISTLPCPQGWEKCRLPRRHCKIFVEWMDDE